MYRVKLISGLFISLLGLIHGAGWPGESLTHEPIVPIRPIQGLSAPKVALGERLFHDVRLSTDNTINCASCHPLNLGGADRKPRSAGVNGTLGIINTPTVYNSAFYLAQFWDGRATSLEEQAEGPVHNQLEMASSWAQVTGKLEQDSEYRSQFSQLYEDGITGQNIQDAIAEFERSLTTPDSRFDRWLLGHEEALTQTEKRGYRLFKSYGCIACHQGTGVGGNMYQRMGAMGDYFTDRGDKITQADLGRFNVTGNAYDRHLFKVPSLRLAALTPPYFHDGRTHDLEKAVILMARYQLGREMPLKDAEEIAEFIKSLVGRHPRLSP